MQKYIHQSPLFWLRNFLIIGQLLIWIMNKYVWQLPYPDGVLLLVIMYFFMNIFIGLYQSVDSQRQMFVHLLIDVIQLSTFFYLTGGATNPFTWFLLIPILFSTTIIKQKYTWILTLVSIVCYSLLIKFYKPIMDNMHGHSGHNPMFSQHIVGMWVGFIVIALLISWVFVDLLNKLREKDQLLAQAELQQAENTKMMALATLATGSAHELGTPLTTMNILTKEMLSDSGISEYHSSLQIMSSQIDRCKDSLTKITASTGVSQAISGKMVKIWSFIDSIQQQILVPEHLDVHIRKNFTCHEKRIMMDITLVQSVVNLITNACDAAVTKVEVDYRMVSDVFHIEITDDGDHALDKIDKTLVSTKEFGLGLGLYLSKTTIERFSGAIEVARQSQKGTRLIVTLPLEPS